MITSNCYYMFSVKRLKNPAPQNIFHFQINYVFSFTTFNKSETLHKLSPSTISPTKLKPTPNPTKSTPTPQFQRKGAAGSRNRSSTAEEEWQQRGRVKIRSKGYRGAGLLASRLIVASIWTGLQEQRSTRRSPLTCLRLRRLHPLQSWIAR